MSDYFKFGIVIITFIFGIASVAFGCYKHTNNITEQENNLKELCLKSDLNKQDIRELCKDVEVRIGEL